MTSNTIDLDGLLAEVRAARLPAPATRRSLRHEAGISLREAAAALGVAVMTLHRWECGQSTPRRAHAVRYRQFLDALRGLS